MEVLEKERTKEKIKEQKANLYDEDGYLIASLEEWLADERAGRGKLYKNWDEFIKYIDKNNSVIIKRLEKKKHLTTKERIVAFCETVDNAQPTEIDWGKPQGKEIW
ncbi:MAG: hypothetical protein FWC41_06600 [Firmicutes bacterium]|nr:hypothetical protein [Bacillota bacterium]